MFIDQPRIATSVGLSSLNVPGPQYVDKSQEEIITQQENTMQEKIVVQEISIVQGDTIVREENDVSVGTTEDYAKKRYKQRWKSRMLA